MRATLWPAVIVVIGLVACRSEDDDPPAPSSVYVATATDPDSGDGVSIALVAQGNQVAAYVCPNDPTHEPYPRWFNGEVADGHMLVQRDGWSLEAVAVADRVDVTLTSPEGERLQWTAAMTSPNSVSGLYTATAAGCTTGVIVIAGDSSAAPVVRGASCDGEGHLQDVTPAQPLRVVEGRLLVEVAAASERRQLFVEAVRTARLYEQ